jgi:tetratricopeptide (TPR) repeat protein
LYQELGRLPKAEALHIENLEVRRRVLGEEHSYTIGTINNLEKIYFAQGRYADAEPLFVHALEIQRRILGNDHPDTLAYMNNLARLYHTLGQCTKAQPLFVEAVNGARKGPKLGHPKAQESFRNLIECYEQRGESEKAEALNRELVDHFKRELWTTFNTMSLLGLSLLGQKNYADAEPLLLKGYEEMKQRGDKIPALGGVQPTDAGARVIQLYESWSRPAQAKEWKQRLGLDELPADVFARP